MFLWRFGLTAVVLVAAVVTVSPAVTAVGLVDAHVVEAQEPSGTSWSIEPNGQKKTTSFPSGI